MGLIVGFRCQIVNRVSSVLFVAMFRTLIFVLLTKQNPVFRDLG